MEQKKTIVWDTYLGKLATNIGVIPNKKYEDNENLLIEAILKRIKEQHTLFHENIGYNILSIYRLTQDKTLDDIYRELQSGNAMVVTTFFTALIETREYNISEIKMFVKNEMLWYTPTIIEKFPDVNDQYDIVRLCNKRYAPGVAMKLIENPKILETNPNCREQIQNIFKRYDDTHTGYFSSASRRVADSVKEVIFSTRFNKDDYVDVDEIPKESSVKSEYAKKQDASHERFHLEHGRTVCHSYDEILATDDKDELLVMYINYRGPNRSFRVTMESSIRKMVNELQKIKFNAFDDEESFNVFNHICSVLSYRVRITNKNMNYIMEDLPGYISRYKDYMTAAKFTYEELGMRSETSDTNSKRLWVLGFTSLEIDSLSYATKKEICEWVIKYPFMQKYMDDEWLNARAGRTISTYGTILRDIPMYASTFKDYCIEKLGSRPNSKFLDAFVEIMLIVRKTENGDTTLENARNDIHKVLASRRYGEYLISKIYLQGFTDEINQNLLLKTSTYLTKEINNILDYFSYVPEKYLDVDKLDSLNVEYVKQVELGAEGSRKRAAYLSKEMREKVGKDSIDRMEKIIKAEPFSVKSFYSKVLNVPYDDVSKVSQHDVKYIKEFCPELYAKYEVISERNRKRMYAMILKKYEVFIKKIKTEGPKNVSLYDAAVILPYFTMDKLAKDIEHFEGEDRSALRRWYDSKKSGTFFTKYETIYKDKMVIGGHELTRKEKADIINFMNHNNFPMYLNLFKITARKYINGEINANSIEFLKAEKEA